METASQTESRDIRERIYKWSEANPRPMPWRSIDNPYWIWLSEIILQQTRVKQGWDYYLRFIENYPTVQDLANAPIDDVLKTWEGLGYYQRARNMHGAAKQIVTDYQGVFPGEYHEIRSLRGVGDYTAAAIASFAFNLPHAVVDGNVIRILTRLDGISDVISKAAVRQKVQSLANELLDKAEPGKFNQAMMDFGAVQCTPKPICEVCPLTPYCRAYQEGIVDQIPKKKKPKPKRERFLYYVVFEDQDHIYVRKRTEKDIWQGLYEFFLIEQPVATDWTEVISELPSTVEVDFDAEHYSQTLSHQRKHARFATARGDVDWLHKMGYTGVNRKKMRNFAFPKIVDCYLRDKGVNLN